MSYPRFPAPFLDGLLDYLPLQTVLALASVDRREAPGREHVINSAAVLDSLALIEVENRDACDAFLTKYRHCQVLSSSSTPLEYVRLCKWGMFTRITRLSLDGEVGVIARLPPKLQYLFADVVDRCCALPDTLERLEISDWNQPPENFLSLPRLTEFTTSGELLDSADLWPTTITKLTIFATEALSVDNIPKNLRSLTVHSLEDEVVPIDDYSLLTELKSLYLSMEPGVIGAPIQFPTSIVHLRLEHYNCDVYPPSLTSLTSGFRLDRDSLESIVWPTALRELTIIGMFHSPLKFLPEGLTKLTFQSNHYHIPRTFDDPENCLAVIAQDIPRSIVALSLYKMPDVCRRTRRWPLAIREFRLVANITQLQMSQLVSRLPAHLTHLHLNVTKLEKPLNTVKWPAGLTHLTINVHSPFEDGLVCDMPRQLIDCSVQSVP